MEKDESLLQIVLELDPQEKGGWRREFSQKSVIIGRGLSANLRLEQPSVAEVHAVLKVGENECTALISDLGSETGTKVNGIEVRREVTVARGDRIRIGEIEMVVVGVGRDAIASKTGAASFMAVDPKIPSRPALPPAPGTQVVRKREILRTGEAACAPSGENFFAREVLEMERPREGFRLLEVKVAWGRTVLDVCQVEDGESISVGDHPDAMIRLSLDRTPGELFHLVTPGGSQGHVVHVAAGMGFEVRHEGIPVEADGVPSEGAVRTYSLKLGDKCRVTLGQLAFVIQYVSPVQWVQGKALPSFEDRIGRWFVAVLILAIGMWFAIERTPPPEVDVSDYLKNPARFAQLIIPVKKQDKKRFEEIKKRREEQARLEDTGKWKKANNPTRSESKAIPREIKEEADRKVATNAGILRLLKGRGGGTGDDGSSIFGGSALSSLDQQLAGLQTSGMSDTGGFGGLGTRGGGPGGGGGGLGLGGMGTAGYGRLGGPGIGSVQLGHRGRSAVQVVKGSTRVVGGLSQEVVGRYIQRHYAQIKFCYERELTKNPELYGKVTVTFTIAGNGRISEALVMQTSMSNPNVEECILRVIRRMVFPQPKGGGQVIVTYPFMFTTAG